jgi:Flp pilus assembly protein TadG
MMRLRRIRDDESGMSYVFIGMGMMAFLSASMLAIDVGMLMTSRNQAQNAADSGALAGATALYFDDYTNRTASGPAVTNAISASTSNDVMGVDVSVLPGDVTFPASPDGENSRVRVAVQRSAARQNGVSTLIARFFGIAEADINAVAVAEASRANAMTCVKPFTIPDKWIEKQTGPWDETDTFETHTNKTTPLSNPDLYIPADQPGYTGYSMEADKGRLLEIRAQVGTNIMPSFFFSIAINGVTGGSEYDWNIANCNTTLMHWGDLLLQEPGAMVGPTLQGVQVLYDKDPGAYWDRGTQTVKGSAYGRSPRVFPIPLYDPNYYETGKLNGRNADLKVANWIGFFLEEIRGNSIYGRITPIAGIYDKNAGPAPEGVFPRAIRLVQ